MPKIGLKIWSTNLQYIPIAQELFLKKIFDYIELFAVPQSLETIALWQQLSIPYIIHAPHSYAGLNPSDADSRKSNIVLVGQVEKFFDALSPEYVIFHPGIKGELQESINQFYSFKESFPRMFEKVLIENKPLVGLGSETCLGASPEEIQQLLQSTGQGFCLDFGHAICYSVAAGKDWKEVIESFLKFKPSMYHLSDGSYGVRDEHEHLGVGKFDLSYLIKLIGTDQCVSIETRHDRQDSLDDFVIDVQRLREYASL